MTITLHLSPDVERKLEALAVQSGEDIESVASNLIREAVQYVDESSVPSAPNGHETVTAIPEGRYPQAVRDEYQALLSKKLHRTMTPAEAARLEAVRNQINQLDRQSASWSDWESRAQTIDQKLTDLRQQLEALPDA